MVVSTDKPTIGDGDATPTIPKADGLPPGNYCIVGWDLDYTGRRLDDEILQIAAYTPDAQFSMYIMPHRDLKLAAKLRHLLKVVTVRRYRVLKHLKTNKPIKTKIEVSGLIDFISWLESVKGDAKDGIILVFHEAHRLCPALLLNCLGKYPHYNLLDRFKAVVVGFANSFEIAKKKCAKSIAHFNLKNVSSVLLEKEESYESAADRARLTYQVLQKLCSEDCPENNAGAGDSAAPNSKNMISCVQEFAHPCCFEEEEIVKQLEIMKREADLKPVFTQLVRVSAKAHDHTLSLRKRLVEANIGMSDITEAWCAGQKDAVGKLLEDRAFITDEKDKEELLTKVEWHFVPELRPKIEHQPSRGKRVRKISKNADKTNGLLANGSQTPLDVTSTSTGDQPSPLKTTNGIKEKSEPTI